MSDTAAQLLFDKENHISQLVVQTGAKQCVDICNPEATKSLNARDKLKVQSKIEVGCGRLVVRLVTVFLCWCRTACCASHSSAGDAEADEPAAGAAAGVVKRRRQHNGIYHIVNNEFIFFRIGKQMLSRPKACDLREINGNEQASD